MAASALIDTHVLIWLVGSNGPPSPFLEAVAAREIQVVVSAVSAFEVALKVRLGKLDSARSLVRDWSRALTGLQARALVVTAEHALAAGTLDWAHGDPFDRLLVAQAQVEGLTLVTADRAVLTAPGVDVLAW